MAEEKKDKKNTKPANPYDKQPVTKSTTIMKSDTKKKDKKEK
ncbi:hypothetical protein [Methanococcus maripaludis]|uniref:Uncharacterized protein n=1 Tax=Methanococcus maripaludis TaxID=39152 RepID=A0A7J9PCH2_METMI|nr:hypothetical protein [Methanococcus maripaludis]MBA2860943.1 hypothetical protein [Methanococcus maripaludis]